MVPVGWFPDFQIKPFTTSDLKAHVPKGKP